MDQIVLEQYLFENYFGQKVRFVQSFQTNNIHSQIGLNQINQNVPQKIVFKFGS